MNVETVSASSSNSFKAHAVFACRLAGKDYMNFETVGAWSFNSFRVHVAFACRLAEKMSGNFKIGRR